MAYQFHESKVQCHNCSDKHQSKIKDLKAKLGGLLCPKCDVILYHPYDGIFKKEWKRRNDKR